MQTVLIKSSSFIQTISLDVLCTCSITELSIYIASPYSVEIHVLVPTILWTLGCFCVHGALLCVCESGKDSPVPLLDHVAILRQFVQACQIPE